MSDRISMMLGIGGLSLILFGVIAVMLDPPSRHRHLGVQVETTPVLPSTK
jgi:hypothetical protein